ncbi:hypothetical protein QJS66_06620 [Kocuria rhizophila]|nr:hypothetical protein QJS66_06620 [Kocuria rhizophila]
MTWTSPAPAPARPRPRTSSSSRRISARDATVARWRGRVARGPQE